MNTLNAVLPGCLAALTLFHAMLLHAAAPWNTPFMEGRDLWHLDKSTADNTSLNVIKDHPALIMQGAVNIDTAEKQFGAGSLSLSGGSVVAKKIEFGGNPRSFELFLKVRQLPEKGRESCIFGMISDNGNDNMMSLYINHRGEFVLKYIYQDARLELWREWGVMQLPQKRIQPGRWTHVSIHFLLVEYNMVRFMVDGEILDEDQMSTYGNWKVRLILGNSEKGDQPFYGWIDEVRIADKSSTPKLAASDSLPIPDPEVRRPLFGDPNFFPVDDLLFYLSLDETLEPSIVQGKQRKVCTTEEIKQSKLEGKNPFKWAPQDMPPRFGPGIRGKALGVGGQVMYPSEGNMLPGSGTASFWFWYKGDINNINTIFKLGEGWSFMLRGSHGFFCATGKVRLAGGGWGANMGRPVEQEWNHVALTWKGEWIDAFLNGRQVNSFLIPGGVKQFTVVDPRLGIGDSWSKYGEQINNYVDELMIFRRALSPQEIENIYRHALNKEPLPVEARHTRMEPCLGKGKLILTVDQEITGITPGENIVARLLDVNGKAVSETRMPQMLAGAAELVFDTGNLSKGDYTIEISQKNKDGGIVFTDLLNYKHYEFPWLKEHVGEEDKVLSPWIPLEAKANTIKIWGREIKLNGLALPEKIAVKGQALLAEPAFFEVVGSDGKVQRLAAGNASPKLENSSATRAVYTGSLQSDLVKLDLRNETEYDGCSKVTLKISAGSKPEEIKRLTLVIPMSPEFARYMNAKNQGFCCYYMIGALPRAEGRVFGSYIIPKANVYTGLVTETDTMKLLAKYQEWNNLKNENKPIPKEFAGFKIGVGHMTSGSFIPYLWAGSPEGGLCWFADKDSGWVRNDGIDTPALEIRRRGEGGIAEMCINFIAAPVKLEKAREIVFGLMPTPVRPLPAGWRKRYWKNPIITGFGKEWTSGRFFKNRGCFGAYQGEPYPMDWDRARWYTDTYGRFGDLQVPYFEFSNIHKLNFPPYMENEWRVQPDAWREQGGIFPTRSYADWWCYHFLRYRKVAAPDGVYFDNVFLRTSLSEYSHGAWRDEEGNLQATYNLWDLRAMLKRVRTVFQETGVWNSWIQLHMTHYNQINAMGFADVLYDGEDFIQKPKKDTFEFLDCWPLDMITAIDSPHTWGVPTRFLQHMRGTREEWDKLYKPGYYITAMRAEIGSLLLVDCYSDILVETMIGIRNGLVRWGVLEDDCGFIGHWRDLFKTGDPEVIVSAYQRPDTLLLIVQNRDRANSKAVQISFNPEEWLSYAANNAEAADQETQTRKNGDKTVSVPLHPEFKCSLHTEGGGWMMDAGPIPPRDFRLISISRNQ